MRFSLEPNMYLKCWHVNIRVVFLFNKLAWLGNLWKLTCKLKTLISGKWRHLTLSQLDVVSFFFFLSFHTVPVDKNLNYKGHFWIWSSKCFSLLLLLFFSYTRLVPGRFRALPMSLGFTVRHRLTNKVSQSWSLVYLCSNSDIVTIVNLISN